MNNTKYLIFGGSLFFTLLLAGLQGTELKSVGVQSDPTTGETQPVFKQGPRINPLLIQCSALLTFGAGVFCFKDEILETGAEVIEWGKERISSNLVEDIEKTPAKPPVASPVKQPISLTKPAPQPVAQEEIDYPDTEDYEEEPFFSSDSFEPVLSFEEEFIQTLEQLSPLKGLQFQGKTEGFGEEEYRFSLKLQSGIKSILQKAQGDLEATKFNGRLFLAEGGLAYRHKKPESERTFPSFDLPARPVSARLPFLAGYDGLTKEAVLGDFGEFANLGVGGSPNMGKDNYVKQIIASIMAYSSPEEVQFAACDTSSKQLSDYQALAGSPYLINSISPSLALSTTSKQSFALLNRLSIESVSRSNLFKQAGVENIWQYREKGYSLPCFVILFCETYDLFSGDEGLADRVSSFCKTGRSQGMFAILSTQQPNGTAMPTNIRSSLGYSLMLKTPRDALSLAFFNEEQPTSKLFDKGHGIFYDGFKHRDVQSAMIDSATFSKYAHPSSTATAVEQPAEEFYPRSNVIEFRRKA